MVRICTVRMICPRAGLATAISHPWHAARGYWADGVPNRQMPVPLRPPRISLIDLERVDPYKVDQPAAIEDDWAKFCARPCDRGLAPGACGSPKPVQTNTVLARRHQLWETTHPE